MSINFPRLDPNLIITTAVEAPTSVKAVESIKQDAVQKLLQIGIGKEIRGEVLAKLRDGSFIAQVNDEPMRLALPTDTQIGAKLSLTLLHLTPRPIFLLNGQHHAPILASDRNSKANTATTRSTQVNQSTYSPTLSITSTDSRADLTILTSESIASHTDTIRSENQPSHRLQANSTFNAKSPPNLAALKQFETTDNTSSKTDLSTIGQLINKLLQETTPIGQKLSITGNQPLLTEASKTLPQEKLVQQLETQLRQNISNSGLFYESHVADWVAGKKSIETLQSEPQAQISLGLEGTILTDSDNLQHANLAQIIHQQLDILEHQKLNWSGMLASNVPMQWRIEEHVSDQHSSPAENPSENEQWHSYLRIELPHLGVVAIHINLNSGLLKLDVQSENATSVGLLKSEYSALKEAIENTGTPIQAYTIAHHEQL